MGRRFCTLFDASYLTRGLAMHASLQRWAPESHLTAICFDDEAFRLLTEMAPTGLTAIPVTDLEAFDPELLAVKDERSRAEYCWTATSCVVRYLLARDPDLDEITYLDADLFFFADPEPLFAEMGDASTLITPHRFAPEYRQYEVGGRFNVQFMTFRRTRDGLATLEWWRDRCIEWCFNRLEPDRMGDQKYVDRFAELFDGVHELAHIGGGVAPWNVTQYRLGAGPTVNGVPVVFFHYHGLKLVRDGRHVWRSTAYPLSQSVRRSLFEPYFSELERALGDVRRVHSEFDQGLGPPASLGEQLRTSRASASRQARREVRRFLTAIGR